MWMDEKSRELKERISGMSDQQLLNIVEVDFDDYRQEAIDFAKAELLTRGIEFEEPSSRQDQEDLSRDLVEPEPIARRVPTCARCGSRTRLGVLLGESEITILFSDKDEQRFVEAYACVKCGHVQLVVDLETDVDETPPARVI